jgi:hypothetical protein
MRQFTRVMQRHLHGRGHARESICSGSPVHQRRCWPCRASRAAVSRLNNSCSIASKPNPIRLYMEYETMTIISKGQIEGGGKGDIRGQVRFVASLFSIAM